MIIEVLKTLLHLEPDLKTNKIRGFSVISISLPELTKNIVLNAKSIEVENLKVFKTKSNIFKNYYLNDQSEELILHLKKSVKGNIQIEISFISTISKHMTGFYKTNVKESGECLLVTQFYETDARKVFPCFDLPNYKSIFSVELVVDRDKQAVFNTDIVSEQVINSKQKLMKFIETPKMATTLLFIGIGKLDSIEKNYKGKKFRVLGEIPKAKEHGSFALQTLIDSFSALQDYFEVPYPLTKLDLFVLNNHVAGGMENWGIISLLERMTLYYQDVTTQASQDKIEITITHETVHQWFGDLVTPIDYKKYIWLNESFATYFAYLIVKKIHPEKLIWEKFLLDEMSKALFSDLFLNTVPIELPDDSTQSITITTAPIIYNKGACIIRQLHNYMGPEKFRDGIHSFINHFAYGNASSSDFWNSLELTSSLPINEYMQSWIRQRGHPLLSISKTKSEFVMKQERFTFTQGPLKKENWPLALKIITYYPQKTSFQEYLLKESEDHVLLQGHANMHELFYFFKGPCVNVNLSCFITNSDFVLLILSKG